MESGGKKSSSLRKKLITGLTTIIAATLAIHFSNNAIREKYSNPIETKAIQILPYNSLTYEIDGKPIVVERKNRLGRFNQVIATNLEIAEGTNRMVSQSWESLPRGDIGKLDYVLVKSEDGLRRFEPTPEWQAHYEGLVRQIYDKKIRADKSARELYENTFKREDKK